MLSLFLRGNVAGTLLFFTLISGLEVGCLVSSAAFRADGKEKLCITTKWNVE